MSDGARIILVLGGVRSGKSARAEALACGLGRAVTYVACCLTAGFDDEMRERVRLHRERRPRAWRLVEDRLDLDALVGGSVGGALLIDSLTLWVSGRMMGGADQGALLAGIDRLLEAARRSDCALVSVSDEVGLAPVSGDRETRAFRDALGLVNQRYALGADRVELVVAGCSLALKGGVG